MILNSARRRRVNRIPSSEKRQRVDLSFLFQEHTIVRFFTYEPWHLFFLSNHKIVVSTLFLLFSKNATKKSSEKKLRNDHGDIRSLTPVENFLESQKLSVTVYFM